MRSITTFSLIIALLGLINYVNAETILCNATSSCPESAPCCGSASGECGTGSYCLTCDPRFSYNTSACMPAPICKDSITVFSSDKVKDLDTYLGNASETDWIYSGYLMDYDEGMIIALPNQTSGTVVYSTSYVWYGKVTAKFKSSRGKGVVSAFILYSDVQDEIDYEFVGADLYKVQTNFYYEGVLNYTNSRNITTNSTFEYFHEYSIEWTEDEVVWSVNGVPGRTLRKEDTYNETSGQYMFPQTPSKVELSLWPAGDSSNAIGTINWAGGDINWDAADFQDPGYLYAIVESIEIECYDPPSGTKVTGNNSYTYNSTTDFSQDSVMITDDRTYLGSSEATGFDRDAGKEEDDEDESSSSSTKKTTQVSTIVSTNSKGEKTTQVTTHTTDDTQATYTATGFDQGVSSKSSSSSKGAAVAIYTNSFFVSIITLLTSLLV